LTASLAPSELSPAQRLALVREEFEASLAAARYVARSWSRIAFEPEFDGLHLRDLRRAVERLEDTYIVLLFSQFEALLAHHLAVTRRAQHVPRTSEALINRIALMERLPNLVRDGAHRVREYRNAVVHPVGAPATWLSLPEAAGVLNRFVAPLPDPP